jgi:hypothetical protein
VSRKPLRCRGLLLEVHVAGGPSRAKRAEVIERLTRAIDGARSHGTAGQDTPSLTAAFMLGAIESSVTSALLAGEPERFRAAVPELAQMVVGAYFGDDAVAGEHLAALQAA